MTVTRLKRPDGSVEDFDTALIEALWGRRDGFAPLAATIHDLTNKGRPGPDAGFSASQVHDCLRKVVLDARLDCAESPKALYYMTRGTAAHVVMERGIIGLPADLGRRFLHEERLHATIDGVPYQGGVVSLPVHGQYDLLYVPPALGSDGLWPDYPILFDHKNTKKVPGTPKDSHIWQTSIYCWLLSKNNRPRPTVVEICYMDNDQSKAFRVVPESDESVEGYLRLRLSVLAPAYFDGILPDRVGPQGRWQCGDNRSGTSYCPWSEKCWPKGIGVADDGFEMVVTKRVTVTPLKDG